MARSEYVYLVVDPSRVLQAVVPFTVKRECLAWCSRYQTQAIRDRLQVWRYRDGQPGPKIMGTVQEVLDASH